MPHDAIWLPQLRRRHAPTQPESCLVPKPAPNLENDNTRCLRWEMGLKTEGAGKWLAYGFLPELGDRSFGVGGQFLQRKGDRP
jgi:hypothetical protein